LRAGPCSSAAPIRSRSNASFAATFPDRDGRIIRRRARSAASRCRKAAKRVGLSLAERLRDPSLTLYNRAADHAAARGIIIADTKFEFGMRGDELIWIDEALTPDSSRFWPADQYEPGKAQPSFDKQFVRDYLERIGWNKQPPAPALPPDVVSGTQQKYRDAYQRITGHALD
jgi:phosphoribosylaminoimidazole-succinocarboxamide synthase